jgi:hypothetical protein
VRGSELEFRGTVEIYNASSRPNAVHSYTFYIKSLDGEWHEMDTERYEVLEEGPTGQRENFVFNKTPLTIAPYSGEECLVMAYLRFSTQPYEADIRVEIEDIFGKTSTVVVNANS